MLNPQAMPDYALYRLVTDAAGLAARLEAQDELDRRDREIGPLNLNTGRREAAGVHGDQCEAGS